MKQTSLGDLCCDQRLVKAAEAIIEQGSCMVSKPIRAGMTTSTIMACERKGWPVLALAPTRRILKETVAKAACESVRIPGNSECPLIKPDLQQNPILRQLPLELPDCRKCKDASWCEVLAILRADNPGVMALTYPKLEALMLSQGRIAGEILDKISRAGVVLLDESHELALPKAILVRAFSSLNIPEKYPLLNGVYQRWLEFCQNHVKTIQELMELAEKGHAGQHLSRSASNLKSLTWKELRKIWAQLRKLALAHALPDTEILLIRDIITILSTSQVSLCFNSKDDGESGSVNVAAGRARQYRALNEFLTQYVDRARLLFVSGTNFEPMPGYFSELAGRDIKNVIFPDIRNATKKLTLIPDKWKLNSRNFGEKLSRILDTIKAIAEREKQPIYLLARNSKQAEWLAEEIAKLGIDGIFVDYFRSDRSIGVERNERICIAIGMAESPANSCDALAHGRTPDERWLDSRRLRILGVDAATWQAVNRVKDPDGITESRIYFVGCTLDQVRKVATWGTNRQAVCLGIEKRESRSGEPIRKPIFEIKVDEEIEHPKIYGDGKNMTHSNRRSLKDFIERIDLYGIDSINSENHAISSSNITRENGVKNGIYNIPSDEIEIDSTSNALYSMFVNRTDCHAQQYKNSKTEKFEYYRVKGELTKKQIEQHVGGEITVGVYQIALDDTVTWCCDDIDSHNGETDAREKVCRLVKTCRTYGIPYLLEASGSVDSYHLWIFLSQTRTYNAYCFIRQLNAEAKVECEAWPKQKSLDSKDGKYGNLVKLPICYNLKSEAWSAFIDSSTFEPLEGIIFHPGVVHLLEIPDSSGSEGMPKVNARKESTAGRRHNFGNTLRYCMERALEDCLPLTGIGGHHFRMAIACEGRALGMTLESVAQLFQKQEDFNYEISLKKSREAWDYDYSPWSCAKLQDQCCSLVKGYCLSCPSNRRVRTKGEA